jgi:uncharacterized protein YaaW (UPF0174 family)
MHDARQSGLSKSGGAFHNREQEMSPHILLDRRSLLAVLVTSAGALAASGCRVLLPARKPIARVAPLVKPEARWTPQDLHEFLMKLPEEELLELMKQMDLHDKDATVSVLKPNRADDVYAVKKRLLWVSSNVVPYLFRKVDNTDYHGIVTWAARKSGVQGEVLESGSTFAVERALMEQVFAQIWDKLTLKQRRELLDKIDPNDHLKDKAALAALTGAAALATLSTTVLFTGFAFYTTISTVLYTVAGFFGITLPFAAYTGVSSMVAFLSGPIGWAIIGVAAVGGVLLAGRANLRKTVQYICQIHALKAAALIEAGYTDAEVFGK